MSTRRSTLYRWQRRLNQEGSRGLEPRSRRPKHLRRPHRSEFSPPRQNQLS
ncbi:MAG: helix-turn-helix domain-containing protein [Chloroflexi bacterium]|nr:helix-turn-helix domain-containing protein [Chloroflexota bacterium]